jgi:hypothetical protein
MEMVRHSRAQTGLLASGKDVACIATTSCVDKSKRSSAEMVGLSDLTVRDHLVETPVNWFSLEEIAYNWLHRRFKHTDRGTLNQEFWYDWHATRIAEYADWDAFCW